MSWTRAWQQMPYEIQAPTGQLVHEDIYWMTHNDNLIVGENKQHYQTLDKITAVAYFVTFFL